MNRDELEYLNELRRQTKMTNQQISDMSSVPLGSVCRIMSGHVDDPTFYNMVHIIKAMGGSIDKMVGIAANESKPVPTNRNYSEMNKAAISDVYELIYAQASNAYQHTLDACKESYQRAYSSLMESMKTKERWTRIMFIYCAIITVATGALLIFK